MDIEDDKKKPIGEMGADTRIIRIALQALKVNEILTWDEMSELLGRDAHAGSTGYSHVNSARNGLQRDAYVFKAIRKVGLKRLDDSGKVEFSASYIDKTHNSAKKGRKVLDSVDINVLSRNDKNICLCRAGMFGALEQMTRPKIEERLLKANEQHGPKMFATAEMLEQFKKAL